MHRNRCIFAILGLFFLFSVHVYAMPDAEIALKTAPKPPRSIVRECGAGNQSASIGRVAGKRLRYAEKAESEDGEQLIVPQDSAGKSLPCRSIKKKRRAVKRGAVPRGGNVPRKRRRTVFGEQLGEASNHATPDVFQVIACAEAVCAHLLEAQERVQASSERIENLLRAEHCRIVPDRRAVGMRILLGLVEELLRVFAAWEPKKTFALQAVKDLAENIGLHQAMFRHVATCLDASVEDGDGLEPANVVNADDVLLAEKELALRRQVVKLCRQSQYAAAAMALLSLRNWLHKIPLLEHEIAEDLCRCLAVEVELGGEAALEELYAAQSLHSALDDFLRLVALIRALDLTPPSAPEYESPASWLDWACWLHDKIADLEYEISSDEDSEEGSDEERGEG